jgi:hypothetical protein
MKSQETLTDVVRSLKGAPAVIFLAQVLHGGPQTVRMLCAETGYSDKVVRQGLLHLQHIGLSYRDSDLRAWYLVPGSQILALLGGAAAAAGGSEPPVHGKNPHADPAASAVHGKNPHPAPSAAEELSTELSTGPEWGGGAEESSANGAQNGAVPSAHAPARPEACENGWENNGPGKEESSASDAGSSGVWRERSFSRAAVHTTTTVNTQNCENSAAVSKYAQTENGTNGRVPIGDGKLMFWLKRGGIAPGSPKMREIMALKPDLETVKAHVLERQALVRENSENKSYYGVGLLIRKLLDGDPPPPMRCETCLELPDHRGWCLCDYEEVMKR